jgi:hypothetical protein
VTPTRARRARRDSWCATARRRRRWCLTSVVRERVASVRRHGRLAHNGVGLLLLAIAREFDIPFDIDEFA